MASVTSNQPATTSAAAVPPSDFPVPFSSFLPLTQDLLLAHAENSSQSHAHLLSAFQPLRFSAAPSSTVQDIRNISDSSVVSTSSSISNGSTIVEQHISNGKWIHNDLSSKAQSKTDFRWNYFNTQSSIPSSSPSSSSAPNSNLSTNNPSTSPTPSVQSASPPAVGSLSSQLPFPHLSSPASSTIHALDEFMRTEAESFFQDCVRVSITESSHLPALANVFVYGGTMKFFESPNIEKELLRATTDIDPSLISTKESRLLLRGVLIVTNYQLIFLPSAFLLARHAQAQRRAFINSLRTCNTSAIAPLSSCSSTLGGYISLPLASIRRIRSVTYDSLDVGLIELKSKDFRVIRLVFPSLLVRQLYPSFKNTIQYIEFFANFEEKDCRQRLFAFKKASYSMPTAVIHHQQIATASPQIESKLGEKESGMAGNEEFDKGWLRFGRSADYEQEFFQRLGFSKDEWRLSATNSSYGACASYPPFFLVPNITSDKDIHAMAKFRCQQRLPLIVWRKNCPKSISTAFSPSGLLLRAGQPMTGLLATNRCAEEENFFHLIIGLMHQQFHQRMSLSVCLPQCRQIRSLHFFDARPMANAMAQVALGGGYESVVNYCSPAVHADGATSSNLFPQQINSNSSGNLSASANSCPASSSSLNGVGTLIDRSRLSGIQNCTIEFGNIDNIHAMRKSMKAVGKLCRRLQEYEIERKHRMQLSQSRAAVNSLNSTNGTANSNSAATSSSAHGGLVSNNLAEDSDIQFNYWTLLSNSSHFHHQASILAAANNICDRLSEGINVLIHCSDGWDRTCQLVSLVELLSDGYYRTVYGFVGLVIKEWLACGYKFADRTASGNAGASANEESSVFLQFLECVYQIHRQFPNYFQFNVHLLTFLFHSSFSALFGTFLFNNNFERMQKYKEDTLKTESIWTYIEKHESSFTNPLYGYGMTHTTIPTYPLKDDETKSVSVLVYDERLRVRIDDLAFWHELYFYFDSFGFHQQTRISAMNDDQNALAAFAVVHALAPANPSPLLSQSLSLAPRVLLQTVESLSNELDRVLVSQCLTDVVHCVVDRHEFGASLVHRLIDRAWDSLEHKNELAIFMSRENQKLREEIQRLTGEKTPPSRRESGRSQSISLPSAVLGANGSSSPSPSNSESSSSSAGTAAVASAGVLAPLNWLFARNSVEWVFAGPFHPLNSSHRQWRDDKSTANCTNCRSAFRSFLTYEGRRHHCRKCGEIICSDCLRHVYVFDSNKSEKICVNCFNRMKDNQKIVAIATKQSNGANASPIAQIAVTHA